MIVFSIASGEGKTTAGVEDDDAAADATADATADAVIRVCSLCASSN